MFQFEFDEKKLILTIRCVGFWDLPEAERFGTELSALYARLKARHPRFAVVSDSRELALPTKEVATALAAISGDPALQPTGRVAVLVVRMLNKLQADRMANSPLVKAFFDEAEARAWLSALPVD